MVLQAAILVYYDKTPAGFATFISLSYLAAKKLSNC